MTAEQRSERHLTTILEDLYLGPTPSYRDEVLAVATHRRQRPAWAIPGRWLPMADIASRTASAPRVPWRTVGVALVLAAIPIGLKTLPVGFVVVQGVAMGAIGAMIFVRLARGQAPLSLRL